MLADFGADVIVNHHQHCYSGYEIYKGKPIFYGLGNFYFDSRIKRNDIWNEGLLLKLDLKKEGFSFELIPYTQCNEKAVVRVKNYDLVKQKIEKLNGEIRDDKKLEEMFSKYVSSSKPLYPFIPFGNRLLRSLYFRDIFPSMISSSNKALIQNAINCETHREVLLHYLEK